MWRAQTKPQHLAVMERPDETGGKVGYRCAADKTRCIVSVKRWVKMYFAEKGQMDLGPFDRAM